MLLRGRARLRPVAGAAGRERQWPVRLVGSLFGLGAGLIGVLSLLGGSELGGLERERAAGFGLAALVIGAVALLGSLTVRDARALWYCSPRRWAPFRADVLDERDQDAAGPSTHRLRRTEGASADR